MNSQTLDDVLEEMAQASASLAYHKSKGVGKVLSRLHKNKSLYFALCGDAVKIGVSTNPDFRIETLQTGAPGKMILIAIIPDAGSRESECHKKLSHLKIHGEWFRYTEDVDRLIEELK